MADDIEIEILEDGTISIKTSDISEVNHVSADSLLDEITSALGGQRKTEAREHPFWQNRSVRRINGKIKVVKI